MTSDHQRIHASTCSAWYTPPIYLDAVRKVLGEIDLDPASDWIGNRAVRASCYYTETEDGLELPWYGSVFCNPPYGRKGGRSNQALWTQKAIAEYEAGNVRQLIMLINAQTSEKWFQPALDPYPICLVMRRIAFLDASGTPQKSPTHGNAFLYIGTHPDRFFQVFGRIGRCMPPWSGSCRERQPT